MDTAVPVPAVWRGISARRAWTTVVILTALYGLSMMDRVVISILVDPIKRSLDLNDFQAGLLLGPAFAVTFVACGIPFGFLLDVVSRRTVILFGVVAWSVATVACGLATSFTLLFLARAVVGTGEATIVPASQSLISDLFPRARRGAPLSIFQFGGPLGGALALFFAGLILDFHGSPSWHMPLVEHLQGWQKVFLLMGTPGILLAFLPRLLPEPRELPMADVVTSVPGQFFAFLAAHRGILAMIFLVFACSLTVSYAQNAWTAEYLRRSFHWSATRIGSTLGIITLVFPLTSHATSGFVVDYLSRRRIDDAPLRLFLIMACMALPFAIRLYLTSSPTEFIICQSAMMFLFTPTLGFAAISIQLFTPTPFRARLAAAFLTFITLVGLTIGPALVGIMTDFGFKNEADLGLALTWVVSSGVLVTIVLLALSLRSLRRAVARSYALETA